jgi:hypothetical protein
MARLQARARSRALARLAAMFPYTFDAFYAEELAKEGLVPRRPRRHGTRSCYVGGCRRPECCEAANAYARERRAS